MFYPALTPVDFQESQHPIVRVDAIAKVSRNKVLPAEISGKQVFHYSIPNVQDIGTGKIEDGDTIDSDKWLITEEAVLISKLNPRKSTICLATPQENVTVTSTEFVVLSAGNSIDNRYLKYVLESEIVRQFLSSRTTSATRSHQRVTPHDITALGIPWPEASNRAKTVEKLDRELAEIDEFIADQQRLNLLLKEKLDTSIEHEMWNQNFDLVPLKYVSSILSVFAFKSSDFVEDDNQIPLLRGVNVGVSSLRWNDTVYLNKSKASLYHQFRLQIDDLILGLDRPVISNGVRVAKISEAETGSLLVQRAARIRVNSSITTSDWVHYALNSSRFREYLQPIFTGVSVPHISPDQLSNFKIPLPPLQNQLSTSRYFQNKLNTHEKNTLDITKTIFFAEIQKKLIINNSFRNQ
ncbi:restriction endonuclease subunit S [Rothia endophytica]|uniref:restriction endonuclease subunit S n=1 Tax=Rothia endophytica TaxID=1324766 RepID=UPI001EFFC934|nr:restriction endonuclease subunit S [Rothia endophytica]